MSAMELIIHPTDVVGTVALERVGDGTPWTFTDAFGLRRHGGYLVVDTSTGPRILRLKHASSYRNSLFTRERMLCTVTPIQSMRLGRLTAALVRILVSGVSRVEALAGRLWPRRPTATKPPNSNAA